MTEDGRRSNSFFGCENEVQWIGFRRYSSFDHGGSYFCTAGLFSMKLLIFFVFCFIYLITLSPKEYKRIHIIKETKSGDGW